MSSRTLTLCILIIFVRIYNILSDDLIPQVTISSGIIVGRTLRSRLENEFYAFRGIPYGSPPLGDLRFKDPQPVKPWTGIFNATEEGPICWQAGERKPNKSEDCLRLNVYTQNYTNATLPVLFFIHDGGWYAGSGSSSSNAGPYYLIDQNIVIVTFNYRLGTFGFLSLDTPEYPGNAGMKDQVLALRWVKENIIHFGGDPNRITIMGNSAGGMSVVLHLVSEQSRELFQKAITMSGGQFAQYTYPKEQIFLAKRQSKVLGCNTDSLDLIIECLKNASAREIANSVYSMFEFGRDNPIILWTPVIESDFGQERFLKESPNHLLNNGSFAKVPLMAGVTQHELTTSAIEIINNETLLHDIRVNFNKVAPLCLQYERNSPKSEAISQRLYNFYNLSASDSLSVEETIRGLSNLISDGIINFGVHKIVTLMKKHTEVYYYHFSYRGQYSYLLYPAEQPYGVEHCDDTIYLLVRNDVAPLITREQPEWQMIDVMTQLWGNFIKAGNPNESEDGILKHINWLPVTLNGSEYYLDIGDEIKLRENLHYERMQLWSHLFP